ncbi:MAG: copper amine oxidase N-terminal domain-containing protein [Oscillospiraceae bacterium]|nr:copper amine oxidase N-terminal domain-containing protein [Oscillospiraceae bacterium]
MKKLFLMIVIISVLLAHTVSALSPNPIVFSSRCEFHNSAITARQRAQNEVSSIANEHAAVRVVGEVLEGTVNYFDFINVVPKVELADIVIMPGMILLVYISRETWRQGELRISWFLNRDVENFIENWISVTGDRNIIEITHNGNRIARTGSGHTSNQYRWVEDGHAVQVTVPSWLLALYPEETFFDIHKINVAMPNTFTTSLIRLNDRIFDIGERPTIENNRTLVPIRAISEALGADVDWDERTQEVTLATDEESLSFVIGEMVEGMDVPAQIINDRTFVPLRFIGEFFGADVEWNEETQTVIISTN